MQSKRILVTGANGQLGMEMRILGAVAPNEYIFTDVEELDITDKKAVEDFVCQNNIQIIVNCAAYTNVDRAEEDEATAERINAEAVRNLAEAVKRVDDPAGRLKIKPLIGHFGIKVRAHGIVFFIPAAEDLVMKFTCGLLCGRGLVFRMTGKAKK